MQRIAIGAMAALAAIWWAYGAGHAAGVAQAQDAHQRSAREAHRAIEEREARINQSETARLAAEAARIALTQQLEDMAHADPVSNECGLPLGRVLRIDQR